MSKETRMLVMIGNNFSNMEEMNEDTKSSLQNFVVAIMEVSV